MLEIKLNNASVKLGQKLVLERLHWHFAGENWQITGPNGSGKTTFLKLVAGILWPLKHSSRLYRHKNHPWQCSPLPFRDRISLLSNETMTFYRQYHSRQEAVTVLLSGLRNQPLLYHEPTAEEIQRAASLVEEFEMQQLLQLQIQALSDGQLKRILLARALLTRPDLLLLDEPLNDLDQYWQKRIKKTIKKLSANTPVLFTSHRGQPIELPGLATFTPGAQTTPKVKAHRLTSSSLPRPAYQYTFQAQNIDIYIRQNLVLRNLDIKIKTGQNWYITGPNGSGKSTLLRTLFGLHPPACNKQITFFELPGRVPLNKIQKNIGLVAAALQDTYKYNVDLSAFIGSGFSNSIGIYHKFNNDESNSIENILIALGLAGLRNIPIRQLSYGQLRLAMIARALVKQPRVLLLDEPLNGLDLYHRGQVKEIIQAQAESGVQIILTSHPAEDSLACINAQCILSPDLQKIKIS